MASLVVMQLDASGHAVAHAVPAPLYQKTLATALAGVNDSVLPVLEKREPVSGPAMILNAIGIGLGLSAQIGLGPLLNLTISPQLRLIYTDSKNPVYPN